MANVQAAPNQSASTNDYFQVPATEKQLNFARKISQQSGVVLPWDAQQNRYELSRWIDANKAMDRVGKFSNYPSSKQVAFAERIARTKRRDIPNECFRDRSRMSKWIDGNR